MQPHEPFSRATLQALELPSLLGIVAQLTASDLGFEKARATRPFRDQASLCRHRQRYLDVARLVAGSPLVRFSERPLAPLLEALARGGQDLGGRDLVGVADLLDSTHEAIDRIREADPPCPGLAERVAELESAAALRRTLRKTFDSRGDIRENATPELARLRRNLRSTRQKVYDRLRTSVESLKENLSEDTIPMRGGRLVLMLNAGAKGRASGLIHGRSGTGRSFYFEPLDAVEDNNQLQQISEEEAAERRRILAEMISTLRRELPTIRTHADLLAELDTQQAAARFAEISGGRLAELCEQRELELVAARHPLIDPKLAELRREALGKPGHLEAVVPLDLELDGDNRALVVTGPNAGGKTVALKTLGLLALAHQCGLPIPVEPGSRIPFFDAIVATVGDDQDLLADRSTFSGRLLRLKEAWEVASPRALVLLDELGSGTDPEEGAALSTAVLEGLIDRGPLTMITTHLGQVAAAALESPVACCAAMLFDSESGRPTYRLLPGPPGGSEALALARRLGLPEAWLDRAEELLGSEHRDLRRLLAELEVAREEVEATRRTLEQETADVATLRRRLAEQEAALTTERKTLGKSMRGELDRFRAETLRRLNQEVETLREQFRSGRRKSLASEGVARLFKEAPPLVPEEETPEGEISVGRPVRHRRLGWRGTLEKLERKKATVRVNGKVLSCGAQDLVPASASEPARNHSKPPSANRTPRRRSREAAPDLREAPSELMLIGQRVEPALEALDRFLDQSLRESLSEVRIVHGHGTGRLRKAVRSYLRQHRAVAGHRPGNDREGGDGATVVDLAGA